MNRVVGILMKRDNISLEDAEEQLRITQEELDGIDDYGEVENIIANNLGLEMDYIFDILPW